MDLSCLVFEIWRRDGQLMIADGWRTDQHWQQTHMWPFKWAWPAIKLKDCNLPILLFLPSTKEEVHVFARVCLSVCLLARLLKNACIDLDEMLRVDRCRDMDELINFEPYPYHSPGAGTGLLSPIGYGTLKKCLGCQRAALLRWILPARASRGFQMVLFTEPSEDLRRR